MSLDIFEPNGEGNGLVGIGFVISFVNILIHAILCLHSIR